jgi:autotransporter translocation and assembly factor TamB
MAVDGKWTLKIKTPMGEQSGNLELKAAGATLTGTMSGNMGSVAIENGSVDGNAVKWSAKVTSPMPITLEFDGKVDGDQLNGNVKLGAFGTSTFGGARA